MPNKRFEELRATGALPTPPGVGMEILRITSNHNCSVDELARVIQSDPALTGRLLQIANSAHASGEDACSSVVEATKRLGLRTVRSTALGFSLVSAHRNGACQAFDYGVFWSQCLARAVAANVLATRYKCGSPSEAFVAGLLSDLGSLALAMVHPKEFTEILASPQSATAAGRAELEQKHFGIDHREVSASILEEWKLPEAVSFAAACVGSVEPPAPDAKRGPTLSMLVWTAARFAEAFIIPEDRPLDLERVHKALAQLPGWQAKNLPDLWTQVAAAWRQWGELFEIVTHEVPPYGAGAPTRVCLRSPLMVPSAPPVTASAPPQRDPLLRTGFETADTKGATPATAPAKPSAQSSAAPRANEPAPEGANQARVLVVDADVTSQKKLVALLQKAGHTVRAASSGEEGLRLAMDAVPQIVVADWNLPGMGGIGLVRALRAFEAGRRVYVVVLTNERDERKLVEALDAGLDDHLGKPVQSELLLARMRSGMRVVRMQERIDADKATMQRQVAEMGVLARRLELAAVTDVLTTLPNRRFAMDSLRESWERSARNASELSVVMVDIDRFKRVNDTYGHDAGDAVLKKVAGLLRQSVAAPMVTCRLGGEEFVVLLPGSDTDAALALAESMRAHVAAEHIRFGGFDGNVTASFGVATRTSAVADCEQLLKLADEGLYRAKEGGRNQVACVQRNPTPAAAPLPARR